MERQVERIRKDTAEDSFTYFGVNSPKYYTLKHPYRNDECWINLLYVQRRIPRHEAPPKSGVGPDIPSPLIPTSVGYSCRSNHTTKSNWWYITGIHKEILHLPQSIWVRIIYCGRGSEGLCFPKLEHLVPLMILMLILECSGSCEPTIRAVSGCTSLVPRLHKLENVVRIDYPYTASDLQQYKRRYVGTVLKVWNGLGVHDRAVPSFRGDKVGNAIMWEPSLLKPFRFIIPLSHLWCQERGIGPHFRWVRMHETSSDQ